MSPVTDPPPPLPCVPPSAVGLIRIRINTLFCALYLHTLLSLPVIKPYKSTLKSASLHHHVTNPKPGLDGFRQQTLLIL